MKEALKNMINVLLGLAKANDEDIKNNGLNDENEATKKIIEEMWFETTHKLIELEGLEEE